VCIRPLTESSLNVSAMQYNDVCVTYIIANPAVIKLEFSKFPYLRNSLYFQFTFISFFYLTFQEKETKRKLSVGLHEDSADALLASIPACPSGSSTSRTVAQPVCAGPLLRNNVR